MKLVYLLEAAAVGRVIGTAIDKMFMVKFILFKKRRYIMNVYILEWLLVKENYENNVKTTYNVQTIAFMN